MNLSSSFGTVPFFPLVSLSYSWIQNLFCFSYASASALLTPSQETQAHMVSRVVTIDHANTQNRLHKAPTSRIGLHKAPSPSKKLVITQITSHYIPLFFSLFIFECSIFVLLHPHLISLRQPNSCLLDWTLPSSTPMLESVCTQTLLEQHQNQQAQWHTQQWPEH